MLTGFATEGTMEKNNVESEQGRGEEGAKEAKKGEERPEKDQSKGTVAAAKLIQWGLDFMVCSC